MVRVAWCALHVACCMLHLARKVNGSNGSTWCGVGAVYSDNFPCGFSYNYPFNSTKCYDQTAPTCAVKGAHLAVRCGTVAPSDAPCLFDSATDSVLTLLALSVLYAYSTRTLRALMQRVVRDCVRQLHKCRSPESSHGVGLGPKLCPHQQSSDPLLPAVGIDAALLTYARRGKARQGCGVMLRV
jgi:hypothetical protein